MFDDSVSVRCANCAMLFTIPKIFYEMRKEDGRKFYCPAGHEQYFSESDLDKARRERDRLKQMLAQKDDAIADEINRRQDVEKTLAATRGQVTKLRNRAKAGLCTVPGCNRHFTNLERHMASKHSELVS